MNKQFNTIQLIPDVDVVLCIDTNMLIASVCLCFTLFSR